MPVDVTAETSVAITTVTVSTVDPGLVTVFSRLVAVFLTDWIHTWRYTEGTLDFISIHTLCNLNEKIIIIIIVSINLRALSLIHI